MCVCVFVCERELVIFMCLGYTVFFSKRDLSFFIKNLITPISDIEVHILATHIDFRHRLF